MNYFLLLRKADELGINFWLGGLALGLGAALFLQSFYYFSVINRDLPATVQSALAKSEEAERGKNAVTLASRVHATIAQKVSALSLE